VLNSDFQIAIGNKTCWNFPQISAEVYAAKLLASSIQLHSQGVRLLLNKCCVAVSVWTIWMLQGGVYVEQQN
jgi:hypothetical protein